MLDPIQRITSKKQLRQGLLVGFRIANDSFGYAVAINDYGSMWLLNVRTEGHLFMPTELPESHAKWLAGQGDAKIDREMWGVAHEELSSDLKYPVHIYRGMNSWMVDTPDLAAIHANAIIRSSSRPASEEDLKTIPIDYGPDQIGKFAEERFNELELINGKPGWTMVPPEKLAKAKRPSRPKPTGEHRIEVYVKDFNDTKIASRLDLEEDIKEAIEEHGFVSGGGSLVGQAGEEGGHVDIECSAEDVTAVLRGVRRVLKAGKAPPDTAITDVTLMDDGSEKVKTHLLDVPS